MTNNYFNTWSYSSQKWLKQFLPEEKRFAKSLLDELIIEDTLKIQEGLRNKFYEIVSDGADSNTKFIVLPVTDIKYKDTAPHAAFVDIDIQKDLPITPGSEAQVAHWIRNQHLSLEENLNSNILNNINFGKIYKILQNGKSIRFICVSDFSLSGSEIINFIRPIQKLIEYFETDYPNKLKIDILCHAISNKAIKEVVQCKIPATLYFTKYIKTLTDCFWLHESLIININNICDKYTLYMDYDTLSRKHDDHRYGYKDTFSLTITDSFVPDNTPSIFWKSIHDRCEHNFTPLIPNRYSLTPSRNSEVNTHSGLEILDKLSLSKIQKFMLAREETKSKFTTNLVLLLLQKYEYLYFSQICILFNSPADYIKRILDSAKNNSLIEYSFNLQTRSYDWKVVISQEGHNWLSAKRLTQQDAPRTYNISSRRRNYLDRGDDFSYYR